VNFSPLSGQANLNKRPIRRQALKAHLIRLSQELYDKAATLAKVGNVGTMAEPLKNLGVKQPRSTSMASFPPGRMRIPEVAA